MFDVGILQLLIFGDELNMRYVYFAFFSSSTAIALTVSPALAQEPAHASSVSRAADQVVRSLKGKVCTTKGGAKFTFENDGHYSYTGLWRSQGHYSVEPGAVKVLLDSGLERDFRISMSDGTVFIENTAVICQ